MKIEFLKISIEIAIIKPVHTGGVFVKTDLNKRTKGTIIRSVVLNETT